MEELAVFAQNGMQEADYLLRRRIPGFLRMMKRAEHSLSTSPLLGKRLMEHGATSFTVSESPLPELTPSTPSTPFPRSPSYPSSLSLVPQNSTTSLPDAVLSPMPTLSADIDVSAATTSVIGRLTMTEMVEEFMEDLLTQEFSPVLLDEDI